MKTPRTNSNGRGLALSETSIAAFWSWFGDCPIVDELGRPRVMYHGTKDDFDGFDLKKAGRSDPGLVGRALYFTPSPEQASSIAESAFYGRGEAPNVIPVYVSLQNPVTINDGRFPDGASLHDAHPSGISSESAARLQKKLRQAGYDGAIFVIAGEITQVVAFDPSQVKSAIGNPGTYCSASPHLTDGHKIVVGAVVDVSDLRAAAAREARNQVQSGVTPRALRAR